MNLASPRDIRDLLSARGLRPSRALGQNFLVDRNILDAILAAAAVDPRDHVLEVGPGLGVLTEALLARGCRVTAVEKDAGLHAFLAERWAREPRLTLLRGDALELDLAELLRNGMTCLVSNLPYSVGTRVVVDAALQESPPERMIVLVQREVAERFVAAPRSASRGILSVWLQLGYDIELVRRVKPTCFWPKPDVVSALVRLRRQHRHPLTREQRTLLLGLTRIGFQKRRKQLASLFRDAPEPCAANVEAVRMALEGCQAGATARAEELSVAQWCALARGWPGKA